MAQFPSFSQTDNIQPTQQIPGAMGYQQPGVGFPGTLGMGVQTPGTFPQYQQTPLIPSYQPQAFPSQLPFVEQSYIENILRLNRGKVATVYMNFENSQWGSKVFKGVIEAAGKDHIILSDPVTGMRYLLLSIYLNYITFDEPIAYDYPYGLATPGMQTGTFAPFYNAPTAQTPPPIPTTQGTPYTQFRKKEIKEDKE